MENEKKIIKIGLIGLGTVGSGVYKTLQNSEFVKITKIAVKNINKPRNIEGLDKSILTDDPYEVVNSDADIVVELIGGVNPAFDLIKTAIENGKHIVTANKELLAKRGEEIFNFAEKHNKVILYEAAIAGGIPIIMPIKTILAGNKITRIEAILNGTTNYILTKMDADGASYADVLKEAQELGYAETDPTGDVEGFDAAYKITTLATIAFGKRVKFENVYPTIIPNWDYSPRSGYYGAILKNSTPALFQKHVEEAILTVEHKKAEHQIIILKSWNEWAEGNYIEPDLKDGRGYLEALRNALDKKS